MNSLRTTLESVLAKNDLLVAFAVVGLIIWISYRASAVLTRGRFHGSAIAILFGLILAWCGGASSGGKNGLADIKFLTGIGVLGGAMFRDFAITATAFGVQMSELKRAGFWGVFALFLGIFLSFIVGAAIAYGYGYRDAVSLTTIGAGAATYIVGPVTGHAIGADSDVIALSIAAGLVKAILVMTTTPMLAKVLGLNNPRTAMIFGGLMGTTSGVTGGLAATDPKLVPFGAITATFYTGLGCLLGPSFFFILFRAIFG